MAQYDFQAVEAKWQRYWKEQGTFIADKRSDKPKYYVLDMFPYPSGAGLHVGHPLGYIASDILARYKRQQGYNVLHPMGFDAFGLPAEQYAIQHGKHPAKTTEENITTFKRQLDRMGLAYDTDAEFRTCDPEYYHWTQWIFLQLFHSWFDAAQGKARPIQALEAEFAARGNRHVQASHDPIAAFSAEDWNSWDQATRERVLLHYRLAYTAETTVNWCPDLGTVLANDEVKDGYSERGGFPVYRKPMRQWMLRISAYAERLLEGLDRVQWPHSVVEMQRNWIGKSRGARLNFPLVGHEAHSIEVFTTRPDTLFGSTFMVLAPEHPLVTTVTVADRAQAVQEYVQWASNRSELERMAEAKQVSGVFTGGYARNPVNNEALPIYVADYVLIGYGTGAIMAVPGHDGRDHAFARHFELPIREVVQGGRDVQAEAYEADAGELVNSDFLDGLQVPTAQQRMIEFLEEKAVGQGETQYRLRDAIFSRQRYWGAPIPITYPEGSDLPQPVPEDQLPVTLPDLSDFQPTGTGASPLAKAEDWVNRPDGSRRETDTMPGWACSSWYFLRYPDAQNTQRFADDDIIRYWMPVDFYIGGAEHAVGHLMYARFWTKVLYDLGYLHVDEPFQRLVNQGMIQGRSSLAYKRKDRNLFVSYDLVRERVQAGQAEWADYLPIHVDIRFVQDNVMDTEAFRNWMPAYQAAEFELNTAGQFVCAEQVERMSKRYHNVVNPDEVCNEFGADTFRMYEMFMGPLEMSKPWSTEGISGVSNFLSRAWRLFVDQEGHIQLTEEAPTREELKVLHQTLKKVQEDIEALGFNTAVSQFMILVNELTRLRCHKRAVLEPFLRALAPFAPHFCEEIWERMGRTPSIADAAYPAWQEEYVREEEVEYPIQVNGKVRTKLSLPADMPKEEIEKAALNAEDVSRWIADKEVKKVIVVPGKIVNLVVA